MPSGVEHTATTLMVAQSIPVSPSSMPSGVEHERAINERVPTVRVSPSSMPSGVEHILVTPEVEAVTRESFFDAVRR